MAHTKAKSSAKNTRDSIGRRLGVKRQDGEMVKPGDIIVRQRGTKFYAGTNVRRGRDDTLYAVGVGVVKFKRRRKVSFDGSRKHIKIVSVTAS
ncbi:MAG: 50S ribosomal protein L27 [Patescibacteria group bacterium]|nr:50S ribosomal protein L27 [Patescibacteria group bacterium]